MKQWTRDRLVSVVNSQAWNATSRWVRGPRRVGKAAGHEISGVKVPAEVIVYFGDADTKIYQIEQWLPVLERLTETTAVMLVFRRLSALRAASKMTRLPAIFVRRFDDLMGLYDENQYRLCLYVNNGVNNFQSLNHARMVHVHINHGESDKISMVSNQAKAYDRILIAGPAAAERHRKVLIDFDEAKLIETGRPQLDINFASEIPFSQARTIMYAPTWEGENDANNYTSVDIFGERIVDGLLELGGTRIIYKPHPRVARSHDSLVLSAHERMVTKLDNANVGRAEPHEVRIEGNVLAMFDAADAVITDVSSVGLDFLYLYPEKPLVLTDRRNDPELLNESAPVSRGCTVINNDNVSQIVDILREAIIEDTLSERRVEMRSFYFGCNIVGSSTEKFLATIRQLINERLGKLTMHTTQASASESEDN